MSLFQELKRRNVFRVGTAYIVTAWLIMQFVDVVLDNIVAPDWIFQVLMLLLAIGLPIVLVFAWAFELTPDGIKREADVDRSESIRDTTGRKINSGIIAALALVIVVMLAERFWTANDDEPIEATDTSEISVSTVNAKSIAVLPFADMSENKDQEWFGDGLAEEILNTLVKTPDLMVAARTSSFRYKNSNLGLPEIAKELGVAHVLEGSVRRSSKRIRVTAQLIRASDGFHVWSENYDRDIADMIEIQEDLAVNIAKALKTTLDPEALKAMMDAGTRSVQAYEFYLRGLALLAQVEFFSSEHVLQAYEDFEQARSIDPNFAAAHLRAADFWMLQLSPSRLYSSLTDIEPRQMLNNFNKRIDSAIATAKTVTDKKGYMANKAMIELRLRDAVRLYKEYLQARPNDMRASFEISNLAQYTQDIKLQEELLEYLQKLGETDQLAANLYVNRAYMFMQPSLAADFGLEAIKRWPNNQAIAYQTHRTLLWAGRIDEARELAVRYSNSGESNNYLLQIRQACADGRRADAEDIYTAQETQNSSLDWHVLMLLGREHEAERELQPYADSGVPFQIASWLTYKQFDPTPFPTLMAVLEREGIKRPPAVEIPFKCPPAKLKSVAVLPFAAMSNGADDGYFADGLTEEILNSLANLPELLVTARTSSFHFKGKDLPIPEIAKTLGVEHIVEGSVRRSGNKVRITAQLIRAADGFHLWSDTYDRTLEDIFAVQEDIAESIASTLDVVLDADKLQRMRDTQIKDVEAFIALQKARKIFDEAHEQSDPVVLLPQTNKWLDRALEISPGISVAWLTRTDLFTHQLLKHAIGMGSQSEANLRETERDIRNSLDKAWRYAPNDSQRAILDAERTQLSDNWSGLRDKLDKAFKSDDCGTSENWFLFLSTQHGLAPQVIKYARNRLACDPMHQFSPFYIANASTWSGNANKAVKMAEENLDTRGFHPRIDDARFLALLASGQYRNDLGVLGSNPQGSWFLVPRKIFVHALNNDISTAREVLNDWQAEHSVDDLSMLLVEASLGNREAANAYASKIDARSGGTLVLTLAIYTCMCGAPFDLDATPTFNQRIQEAGFDWPPASPIKYPAKTW